MEVKEEVDVSTDNPPIVHTYTQERQEIPDEIFMYAKADGDQGEPDPGLLEELLSAQSTGESDPRTDPGQAEPSQSGRVG
jgi:hypothetical protein